tara:strand:- start:1175 stop:2323 length:1149 start_codon:yes stop_codon:yes gene_type:complete
MTINISNGDCLTLMKDIPDKSVDLFICDLPYGETNCKWDSKIDLEEFWKEFKRIRKSKKTACIHFCSTKFGYTLIKSNESMFKMDMVWKKRNKTGGLQSRNRPMRNHEMVYFFYEQAPKYNRDKYHKRIQATVTSTVEKPKRKTIKDRKAMCEPTGIYPKENQTASSFDPPNPASVISEAEKEEKPKKKLRDKTNSTRAKEGKDIFGNNDTNVKPFNYEPPNPASVLEEKEETDPWGLKNGGDKGSPFGLKYDPPNPASVVEEAKEDVWGQSKFSCGGDCGRLNEDGSYKMPYDPPNPPSVFESTKVFIGKRHHQTEKPQDILEFFIKYWTDEGQTILDPTMGSGSTGVACKTLKRNFIGFEMDEKIFKVAEERIKKVETII